MSFAKKVALAKIKQSYQIRQNSADFVKIAENLGKILADFLKLLADSPKKYLVTLLLSKQ